MIEEGQVVLFRFPQTDLRRGKVRPALVLRKLPGDYDDWLVCMISSRLSQRVETDEIIGPESDDFKRSGLKVTSVIRGSRIAVVKGGMLEGAIGEVSEKRLARIKRKIVEWLLD